MRRPCGGRSLLSLTLTLALAPPITLPLTLTLTLPVTLALTLTQPRPDPDPNPPRYSGPHPPDLALTLTPILASTFRLGLGHAPVQIAINGRDFTSDDGPHFAYYPPPIVSSISPASGPLLGGTRVLVRGRTLAQP